MPLDKFRTGNGPLTGAVLLSITTPTALWFQAELMDAINSMTDPDNWTQDGTVTINQAVQTAILMARGVTPMIGQIIPYITTEAPWNTLPCDGSAHARVDYPSLYAVLDAAFIVDADTFITPDLRGKVLLGASMAHVVGSSGGEETHTLTSDEMPSHTHNDSGHAHTTGNSLTFLALTGEEPVLMPNPLPAWTGSASANLSNTGGGGAHNNMQPYVAVKYAVVVA